MARTGREKVAGRYYAWRLGGGALRGRLGKDLGKEKRGLTIRAGGMTGEHGEGLGPYGYLALVPISRSTQRDGHDKM
jgi:hypothetical protein